MQDRQVRAPWSAGEGPPRHHVPPGATDCHFHVYDARMASVPGTPHHPDAMEEGYRALQQRLGLSRGVLVQPSAYGTDNRRHLRALESLGRASFRMVAVVAAEVTDAELRGLDAAGVCGVRFNVTMPGVLGLADLEPLAKRISALGWHIQLNASEAQLRMAQDVLARLPCRLVLDHLGHVPQPAGLDSDAFGIIGRLLDAGNTWVKLSGPYIRSQVGGPDYPDAGGVAAALARRAPERILWGTDWPHPTRPVDAKPDDARLLDLAMEWAGSDAVRRRMLVENPAEVYGFSGV
ncbi:amidohydrolase family protein [Pseudoroseomonas cervicalis]|uniref:amidohydrolase family protein n=1 Tax=Teichococcus cervicalis TaxID=204525 RepID=UPI002785ECD5|nr:amidohydrolase family protein [Pseudoroseomonas cervicalis]MDQ1079104.1 D-galactarolactone isomerase [Pseudoroseomonas cervicalis]